MPDSTLTVKLRFDNTEAVKQLDELRERLAAGGALLPKTPPSISAPSVEQLTERNAELERQVAFWQRRVQQQARRAILARAVLHGRRIHEALDCLYGRR